MNYSGLLSLNVYSKKYEVKFLVIASCLSDLYPEVVKKFEKKWKNVVVFCLEEFHFSQFMAKMFDILAIGNTQKVGFLTPHNSPHCIQLHFASKYLKRGLNKKINFEHYVVREDEKVFKVGMKEINKAKDFSLIGKEIKI
jgi:hypothetical protein